MATFLPGLCHCPVLHRSVSRNISFYVSVFNNRQKRQAAEQLASIKIRLVSHSPASRNNWGVGGVEKKECFWCSRRADCSRIKVSRMLIQKHRKTYQQQPKRHKVHSNFDYRTDAKRQDVRKWMFLAVDKLHVYEWSPRQQLACMAYHLGRTLAYSGCAKTSLT